MKEKPYTVKALEKEGGGEAKGKTIHQQLLKKKKTFKIERNQKSRIGLISLMNSQKKKKIK